MATRIAILFVVTFGATFLMVVFVRSVRADHNVYLPLIPNTWLMQNIIRDQEQYWCVDSRAASYPSFVAQLEDVNDQYAELVGIKHRRVAISDPACEVQHVMLPAFPCGSGASACIYYANSPVVVHYAEERGYTSWASAHGHELGHGLLGLHEQYRDSGGSIGCTGRSDTVMDCGFPHVRYPQERDVRLGCAMIATAWCGAVQEPEPEPCIGPTNVNGHAHDSCNGWWVSVTDTLVGIGNIWHYTPVAGFTGWEWGPCTVWGGRDNRVAQLSDTAGASTYVWWLQRWVTAPTC